MANICTKCGKKVGVFSCGLDLKESRVICSECASPIRDELSSLLYSANGLEVFNELKNSILEKSEKLYDEVIKKDIENIINEKYASSHLSSHEEARIRKEFLENYMITTGYEFNGYKIIKYNGVISGQVVLGTGFLSEFTASFADFFGEESNKFAYKLETAKNAAVEKLIMKSADKGGNAIIGVDFDYITFHGNMIGVVANGTSVVIEEDK